MNAQETAKIVSRVLGKQITSAFIHVAVTMHREDDSFTDEQLMTVSQSVLAFNDTDVVTGQEAEDVFHDNYQAEWKKRMKTAEDAQDWSGNIDWRPLRLPRMVVAAVALLAAVSDATKTKAWYQYCKDHPETPT